VTVLPWPPGHAPYVTPDQLYTTLSGSVVASQWPVGVQWGTIPFTSGGTVSPAQRYSVLANLCMQATARAEQIVNQPLRSVQTTEDLEGPNYRVTMQWSSGNGRFIAARWPVTQVTAVSVAPNSGWPRQWTALPAGNFEPEYPVDGLYGASVPSAGAGGQSILFAPGYMSWGPGWPSAQISGRQRYRVSATYLSGWPHTALTQAGTAGSLTQVVDDCTGWLITGSNGGTIGAAGIIYDAVGGGQEPVTCTSASAVSGPGTLTFAAAASYAHAAGIMVSAMPVSVIWATALLAGHAALVRGATATTIQTTGGRQQQGMHPLEAQARDLLHTFRRTV
jgi:hypothetical protein